MENTLLKEYELVNTRGIEKLDTPEGTFKLSQLTDEIAAKIIGFAPNYIKKKVAESVPAKAK